MLLFGPAALWLALMRLLQHVLLKATGLPAIGDVLHDAAPVPFVVLLVAAGVGFVLYRAGFGPAKAFGGAVLIGAGLLVAAGLFVPPWFRAWLTPRAFEVIRWDLLWLLALALPATFLLDGLSGRAHLAFRILLHAAVALLLMVPTIELGVIATMGAPPDGALLTHAAHHLGAFLPIIASEIGPVQSAGLLVPLLIVSLPVLLGGLPPVRRWLRRRPRPPARWYRAAWAVVPLALVLALPPRTPLPATHQTISFAGLAQSFFDARPLLAEALPALGEAPFDAETLRLARTDETRRLNVVVIILESFRRRSVTPYTPTLATTPFLDALAQRSLLVEHCSAVVSYTNKALTALLAGLYPEHSREVIEAVPGRLPGTGLPALLQPHGYRTAFFTPAKLSFEKKDQLLDNLGFAEKHGDGDYAADGFDVTNYFGHEDRVMMAPSLAWIDDARAADAPFFLTYLTLTAHHPYKTPEAFPRQRFAPHNERLDEYLNALHYTDAFLRELFDAFEQRGLFENTVFFLVGDHGEAFGEHGLTLHGDVIWEEALEVPAMIYAPALFPEGGRITGARSQLDLLPTVADVLGLRLEAGHLPGTSLLDPAPPGRALFHHTYDGIRAVALREDTLKYVYYNQRQPMQVFDLANDPLERHDIAATIPPEQRKAAELKLLLWRRGVYRLYHADAAPGALAIR